MAGKGAAPGEYRGGRRKGVPNKINAATRERIEKDADPIGLLCRIANGEPIECAVVKDGEEATAIRPTLDQRMTAAQTLARKILPDAKDRPITFPMPEVKTADDVVKVISAVLAAVAVGTITPSEGQATASIAEGFRKAIETHEIEKRIAALEAQQGIGR